MRLSPDHTPSLQIIYQQNVSTASSLRPVSTDSWLSKVVCNDGNDKNVIDTLAESQDSYRLLAARAGFNGPSKKWFIEVFVNSALDEEFLLGSGNAGGSFRASRAKSETDFRGTYALS